MKQQKNYHKFAEVYDRMEADHFSALMVAYTLRLMKRHHIHPSEILDLCCGTGTALRLFHHEGFTVAGLDGSPEMIGQAKTKLRDLPIDLYCQQLPRFAVHTDTSGRRQRLRRFDLVTSFYDALNYLTQERQLRAAFRAVHRHLRPGGWFIFDMNTPGALKTIWGGYVWGGVKDDVAWIWRNEFDEQRVLGTCRSTFFVKRGKSWERFDELHVEKGYENKVITRLLREAGFSVRGLYRCFHYRPPTRKTTRICVVAQRRG